MPFAAGSKGGFFDPLYDTRKALDAFTDDLPGFIDRQKLHQINSLGIYVNNVCNLKCAHCYYQLDSNRDHDKSLSSDELVLLLAAAIKQKIQLFAFVGKEVFMPGTDGADKTIAALRYLSLCRKQGHSLKMGVVTNGFYLDKYLESLMEIDLDYLDISIDGTDNHSHNLLRGKGAFETSVKNLVKAIESNIAKKIFMATTLHRDNLQYVMDILDCHNRYGVQFFNISPIVAIKDESLQLSIEDLHLFFEGFLNKAEKLNNQLPLEVVVDMESYVIARNIDFFSTIFKDCNVQLDSLNAIILVKNIDNIRLILRISLPDPCNSYGCVSHNGWYFDKSGCLFMKKGYETLSMGKITNNNIEDLMDKHQKKADHCIDQFSSSLFFETADYILNALEGGHLYELPQIS